MRLGVLHLDVDDEVEAPQALPGADLLHAVAVADAIGVEVAPVHRLEPVSAGLQAAATGRHVPAVSVDRHEVAPQAVPVGTDVGGRGGTSRRKSGLGAARPTSSD